MAKWKRSGADALREYEQASSYAKNTGAAQMQQQEQKQSRAWKRSGADALREYEQSSSFPQTVQDRKYDASERSYDAYARFREAWKSQAQRRQQEAAAYGMGAQADALKKNYYAYKQAGAPQAAQDAAYQNYLRALHQQDELNRANALGQQLDPKQMQHLTTLRYRDPAQAAAQEAAENTPAAKNRRWAEEREQKRREQLSEQEFNRSGAMQEQYGSYDNYLRGVYAGYDEAVAKQEAEQAKTSEDLQAESDALQTRLDALSDQLKTAYQNPSAENYKNLMELQQQWKDVRKQKKEADQRVSEKQREEKRSAKQAAQEAAQEKYDGWSEERMQGRLDELNRQINLALARSDGTADVSALKTEREALEGEKRRVYPTARQKAGRFLEDAGTAFFGGGNAQAMSGLEMAHNVAETKVNQGAAWALRDIANSATLHALGGDRYAEKLRSLADRLATEYDYTDAQAWQDEYNRIMNEVSQDHSPAGTWVLQQLPSAGAMAVDLMVSTATGGAISPMTAMGIRAGGNAMLAAHNEGATDTQALLIGLQNAAVEMLSEKLFGGNPVYDKDVGLVNKAVSKLTKSKTVMKVLDSKAFDFVSEGAEEAIAELLEPTFQSLVLKGTLKGATNAENIGNAFLGGVFLAALGNLAGLPGGLTQAKQERQTKYYAKILAEQGAQSENAGVREAAAAVQEKLDYGRTPDMEDIGRMLSAMDDAGETQAAQAAAEAAQGGENAQEERTYQNFKNAMQDVERGQAALEQARQGQQSQGVDLYDENGSLLDVGEGWAEIDPEQYTGRQEAQASAEMDAAAAQADMDYLEAQALKNGYDDTTTAYFLNGNTTDLSAEEYAEKFQMAYKRGQLGVSQDWTLSAAAGMNRDVVTAAWEAGRRAAQQSGAAQYSISQNYRQKLRQWNRDGKPEGASFELGTTGATLQGLGAVESDIYMNGDKIKRILKEHPEITMQEIERVPEILEDPVLILKSKAGRGDNSRLVLFGSVKAQNGQPMLAVLDLRATEGGFLLDDMQKVNSAYTKKNPASFIQSSEVLYADEKRTIPLLHRTGLTIASQRLLRNGSMGSISYSRENVNLKGVPFGEVVQTEQQGGDNKKADNFLNSVGYKAERTGNYQLGDTVSEIQKNVKGGNEHGNNVSDEGQKRNAGARAGEQDQRVEQAAGGRSESARRGRERAAQAKNLSGAWPRVTNAELLGEAGTQSTVAVMPAAEIAKNADAKKAADFFRTANIKRYKLVVGQLEIERDGKTFRADGATMADGTVLVRLDSEEFSAFQLAKHEVYHLVAQRNAEMAQRIRKRLVAEGKISRAQIDSYIEAYSAIYGDNTDAYVEEIVADAYAGINRTAYGTNNIRAEVTMEAGQWTKKTGSARAPPESRYSIEKMPDGKQYVKADRQVIFGNDVDSWSEQLEDYINGKIRRGQDVTLIGADGDALILTATSAGKLSSPYTSDGRTMSETAYERKANAAAHIDELAQVSTRGRNTVSDAESRHGDMAAEGWNYRRAYFMDFDGRYYRVTISVAQGPDGKMIYNIGQIKEEASPKVKGSSAETGNGPRGFASSEGSIRQNGENVNGKFSASAEQSDDRKAEQFEVIQNSNAADDDYHTWIRSASEIKTLSETLADPEWAEYDEYDPDYTRQMAEDAIRTGKITVYSSYKIGNGVFVTPSRMEAESYSGDGKVYSKTVNVADIAWIDPTQGQYAPVKTETKVSAEKRYDYTKAFADQIDDWKAGKIAKNDTLIVGPTPDVFRQIGFNALPVTINQTHVDYALNGTKNEEHHIGESMLKQLPRAMQTPVAVIASETQGKSSVVALLPFIKDAKTVIIPVYVDGFGRQNSVVIDSNAITSIYGRKNAITKLLTNAIEAHNNGETTLFYLDKTKATALYQVARVTMPKMPDANNGFVASIRDADSNVKPKLQNVTESQQFKRWFGDWQNHPERASKVVNADGTPKTVYHGTNAAFNTFQQENGVYFFSESRDYAESMAEERGGTRVVEAYLNIRNPLYVRMQEGSFTDPTQEARYIRQAKSEGHDGVVFTLNSGNELVDDTFYAAFAPEQIKSATDNVGTFDRNNPDIRYASAQQRFRDALPERAAEYVARTENALVRRLADNLSVPEAAKRETLRPIADEIIYDVLRGGEMDSQKLNRLFDQAWEAGREADTEYYEQYKDVREKIRTQKLFLSAKDRADIADFNLFRKQTMGTLRFSGEGLPVDTFYQEMQDMAPELFPASITAPSDQLIQLYEVAQSIQAREKTLEEAFGAQAESFKTWARNDFDESVQRLAEGIRIAQRYQEAQKRKQEKLGVPQTAEEAMELAKEVKAEKKKFQKVQSKYLLTDADQKVVNMLLRGDTTPEAVQGRENAEAILKTYEAKADYDLLALRLKAWNSTRKQGLRDQAENALNAAEAEKWVDKGNGLAYMRETMERNIRDIAKKGKVADEKAEAFNNEYFYPVHKNESDRKNYVVGLQDRIRALDLSREVENGNLVSESYAVQWLGEAEFNREYLAEHPRVKQRGGFSYAEWNAAIQKFHEENPKLDYAKIENAVRVFRSVYDQLFEDMNRVRMENGYEPVDYMQGYFPHFQENDQDGSLLTRFGRHLGITDEVTPLPATINGLTQTFRPGIRYMANIQQRLGYATAYDALQGFDRYIEVASDVIYHTGDIQRLRALATQIRYRASDEGVRKQIDRILQDPTLSPDEANERVAQAMKDAPFALSNFVAELDEYTNLLAGKKSRLDRGMEKMLGRKFYNVCKAFESRVGANMVAANIGSALTNFIPLAQAWSQVSSVDMLQGMWQTLQNYKTADGLDAASTFINNRSGYGRLAMSTRDKASEKAGFLMKAADGFTTGSVVRARYLQNLRLGMSEVNAMQEADQFAANIMADRSKGSTPTLYSARNPIIKLFTQFQLEVNNELSWIFKDMIPQERKKGVAQLAKALFKFLIGAWILNEFHETITGRRAALDPLGILNDSVGDFTGYQLPNTVQSALSGKWDFTKEKPGTYQAIKNLGGNLISELPGTQMLTVLGLDEKWGLEIDSGRIAVSSAIPNFGNIEKALLASNEDMAPKKKVQTVVNELANPAAYLALPFGGGQIKKMAQGVQAVIQGGSYKADNEGRDILQYPVYNDNPKDLAKNLAQALLFGKTATEEAQGWVESGFKSLSAKETAAYQEMTAAGADQRDSYTFVGAMKKLDSKEAKLTMLFAYDLPEEGKTAYYYNALADDTEREKMDALEEAGVSRTDYVSFRKAYFGAYGTQSVSQERVNAVLDKLDLPKAKKAAIWRSCNKDWKEENNPYK